MRAVAVSTSKTCSGTGKWPPKPRGPEDSESEELDPKKLEITVASTLACLAKYLTMVAHFVCVLLTAFVAYVAKPGSSLFSWHPTLMTFGYSFFMMEAILFLSPHSSILAKYSRKTKSTAHWIMMLFALACMIGGYLSIVVTKNISHKEHLTTWHGLIGFVTVWYTVCQTVGGVFQVWKWLRDFLPKSFTLSRLKGYHATSGLTLYMLACVTIFLGMQSTWFVTNVTGTSWYACVACPMVLLLVVSNQVTSSYLPKKK